MVPYKQHNAPTSLGTLLKQIAPMSIHLTAQEITKSIGYNVPFHLYGTI